MKEGDYVQHRRTKRRGEVLDQMSDGTWLIYSPNRGPLDEMWWAHEEELIKLLGKDAIGNV